jgi:hypothetical protein
VGNSEQPPPTFRRGKGDGMCSRNRIRGTGEVSLGGLSIQQLHREMLKLAEGDGGWARSSDEAG